MERLLPMLYDELHEMAHRQLARERRHHTLQTTALVHEAYLRLVDQTKVTDRGRAYFFGAAARAMRQVLVDYARKRKAEKRGGGQAPLSLEEGQIAVDAYAEELIDLDEALERLAALNPRHARVVECRFFGGLSVTVRGDTRRVASHRRVRLGRGAGLALPRTARGRARVASPDCRICRRTTQVVIPVL